MPVTGCILTYLKAIAVAGSESNGGTLIPPNQDYRSFYCASKEFTSLKVTSFKNSTSEDLSVRLPPFNHPKKTTWGSDEGP